MLDRAVSGCLDPAGRILRAEAAFAVREEFAKTLSDIVYRRMMIGFDADRGRPYYGDIAEIAGSELGLDAEGTRAQLKALEKYSDSLLPSG